MTDTKLTTPSKPLWPAVLLLIPLAFFLWTGNGGADLGNERLNRIIGQHGGIGFGKHWDEPLLLTDIKASLQNRLLLPTATCNYDYPGLPGGNYEYPSVLYWIGLAVAAPELRHTAVGPAPKIDAEFFDEKVVVNGESRPNLYTIHLRQSCLLISSMAIVATGLLGYGLTGKNRRKLATDGAPMNTDKRKDNENVSPSSSVSIGAPSVANFSFSSWSAAVIAALILATSWQFAYHARWIAPDAIMTVFATACLALCVYAVNVQSIRAVFWAAVMAGLCTGTKYPGGLLMIPLLTAGWLARPSPMHRRVWRSVELTAVVIGVFLVTTPGAIAQPWNFFAWIHFDRFHYGTMGHYGHDIRNHTAMAMAMGEFLTTKLLSHDPAIAVGLSVLTTIGAIALIAKSWRLALVVLPFPLIYFGYFSQQIVLIVRNLLIMAPIAAALAGLGTVVLADVVGRRGRFFSWAVLVAVMSAVAWDAVWIEYSSESMNDRRTADWQLRQLKSYAGHHPDLRWFPSETIATATGWPLVPPVKSGTRDVAVSFAMEDGDPWLWPANVPSLTLATFGAYCVDFDSYPNWEDNRIVVMEIPQARRVPVGHIERIVRRRDLSLAVPDQSLLAYIGCGSSPQVDGNGVRIRAVRGTGYPCQFDVGVPQPDARGIEADNDRVIYDITGLDPGRTYSVGWSWWDWNTGHRQESAWAVAGDSSVPPNGPMDPAVSFALCGPTKLPAWPLRVNPDKHKLSSIWPPPFDPRPGVATHADYAVTLPTAAYRDGHFRFVVAKEVGFDVVLTGLWITATDGH